MSLIPKTVPTGAIRYNTDSNKMECFDGTKWWQVSVSSPDLGNSTNSDNHGGARGIYAGGSPAIANIDYFNMASKGDAVAFGSLGTARYLHGACASSTRAVFGGGNIPESNNMEYITIPSTGSGTSFGNLVSSKRNLCGGGNKTRGVFVGGLEPGSSYQKDIDYITIASTGAAQDFGDLTIERLDAETVCNGSRLVTYAGSVPSPTNGVNTMDYITIASTGAAHDFGEASELNNGGAASGDSTTRGVFMGGRNQPSPSNISTINYITIATLGDTSKFGDLTASKRFIEGTSNKIYAFCCGGYTSSNQDVIEYVNIATEGNGVDFGNLNTSTFSAAATSNSHGGL